MLKRLLPIPAYVLLIACASAEPATKAAPSFESDIKPLLKQFCYSCHNDQKHKGDVSLESFATKESVLKDPKVWETVLHHVRTKEMPPEDKPQPNDAERQLIVKWIEREVFGCDCDHPDPGRVTLRRLNRAEYSNTIRDLVGVEFRGVDDLPADDSGYGFDTIGDSLSLSPIHLEKLLHAAQTILDTAIVLHAETNGPARRFQAERFSRTNDSARPLATGYMGLFKETAISTNVTISKDGDYILRLKAFGEQAGPEFPKMELRVNGKAIKIFDVKAVEEEPAIYQTETRLKRGQTKIAVAYLNNYNNRKEGTPDQGDRNLFVDFIEVVGPPGESEFPESHKRIFPKPLSPGVDRRKYASEIINNFAQRAYRRPITAEECNRLISFYDVAIRNGQTFEASVKQALQVILVSPNFLFRRELQPSPDDREEIYRIDDYALASRLSYFLWSSMPDDRLFAEAKKGTLRKHLGSEVHRLLSDAKSEAFIENFFGQWLQLRQLQQAFPDSEQFPQFNDELREAMQNETKMFCTTIMRENRSILELINANYTFLNERLARHYGISGVAGEDFRRVSLKGSERGGLLTHASILTLTSNPNRTSPVKRGKWVLDTLLGSPPSPPPPDIPPLNEGKEAIRSASLRQRLEEHRKNPSCASCHSRMDPIGFALENFDAIGAWRVVDGKFPIDSSGEFPSGETVNGAVELRRFLIERRKDEFVHCFAEKMLTYALGRGVTIQDRCALDDITKKAGKAGFRFENLVLAIVESTPFQWRRGENVARSN